MTPDRFKEWRMRLGFTQAQAAAELNVTPRAIRHYEGGTRAISAHIAELTDVIEGRLRRKRRRTTHRNGDARDVRLTPRTLFDALDAEFSFDLDCAALPDNALCARFFTPEDDAFAQRWAPHRCWLNPPYGSAIIKWWVQKAAEEAAEGATVVALLPVRTDLPWWHIYVHRAAEVRFLMGRLAFTRPHPVRKRGGTPPYTNAVVVFRAGDHACRVRSMLRYVGGDWITAE